jgi:hypothetical protein
MVGATKHQAQMASFLAAFVILGLGSFLAAFVILGLGSLVFMLLPLSVWFWSSLHLKNEWTQAVLRNGADYSAAMASSMIF